MKGKLLFTLLAGVAFGLSAQAPYTPPFSENFNSGMGEFTAAGTNPVKACSSSYGYDYTAGLQYAGTSDAADAWLFTPAFTLKADLVYKLTYKAKSNGSNTTNKVEWKAGNSASADAMTVNLGEPISYTYNYGSWETTTVNVKVPADGVYYLGMHVISEASQGYIYFDNFDIEAGVSALAPAVPAAAAPQFAVVGDKLTTSIGITVPSQNISGDALTGDVTVKVNRVGFETPVTLTGQPGATVTFTDNDSPLQSATYTITCVSNGHESKPLEVVANPSLGTPKQVENFNVVQEGNVFTLTWDAVTEPVNSSYLFIPSAVTYTVKCGATEISSNISETTKTYTVPKPESGQQAVAFSIVGSFASKPSSAVTSDTFIVGDPLTGEFRESFTTSEDRMGYANSVWTVQNGAGTAWKASVGKSYPTINPQDGDKGCLEFYYTTASDVKIWSPQLDLSSLANPKLKFWVYLDPTSYYETKIQAGFETATGDILLGEQINVKSGESAGWKEFTFNVPNEALTGVTRLMFVGTGGTSGSAYVDNISILGYFDHNLAVEVTAPAKKLAIGEKVEFPAKVINKGGNAEEEWTMALYADNEMVGEVQTEPVPESGSVDISIPFTALPKYAGKDVVFEVRLSLTGDGDRSDNTASVTIPVVENELAVATGLQAVSGQNAVTLSWTAPVVSTEPAEESVTESFEDWENGATTPQNGWVFIDVDGIAQKGLNNLNAGQKFAAMVIENFSGTQSWDPAITAHAGTKSLAITPSNNYGGNINCWIISPEVKGGEDISFWCQTSYGYSATNEFDILYSEGGIEPADFTVLETKYIPKGDWTECVCTLPANAKRFAIHVNNKTIGGDALLFDSFNFTASTAPAVHTGYNLYRNHELIAAALPATQTSYTDSEAEEGKNHTYHLTALYDKGESNYSESATGHIGTLTAVEEIEIGADAEAEYYSLQGIRLASPAPGQIVIVRKAGRTFKAIIR